MTAAVPLTAVDAHAHVFIRGLPLAPQRRHAPDYDATPATYLALLDAAGISHGVLVQPSFLGTDNGYLLSVLDRHRDRLRGVAVVDPATPAAALQALAARGIVGIRLNLVGLEIPDFAAAPWPALFATVRALDWHVELHRDAQDWPALLDALLPTGVKLVVDHLGRPQGGDIDSAGFAALLRAAGSRQVWVKLSAAYRSLAGDTPADAAAAGRVVQALLDAYGPERLLWGSDWPHTEHRHRIDHATSRALLDAWVPDAAQRRQILADTPAALFGFAGQRTTP